MMELMPMMIMVVIIIIIMVMQYNVKHSRLQLYKIANLGLLY